MFSATFTVHVPYRHLAGDPGSGLRARNSAASCRTYAAIFRASIARNEMDDVVAQQSPQFADLLGLHELLGDDGVAGLRFLDVAQAPEVPVSRKSHIGESHINRSSALVELFQFKFPFHCIASADHRCARVDYFPRAIQCLQISRPIAITCRNVMISRN